MTNYFEKEVPVSPSLCDADGKLSIWQLFNLFMDIATDHAAALGVGWADLSPRHLFWLTVKTRVCIEDRPNMDETVIVATWLDPPTKLRGDRNYELRRGGQVLARGKTEWVALNTETMKLTPLSEVYPEGMTFERPTACPEGFTRVRDRFEEADRYAEYTVRSTDIDIGGHMNNVAYVRALLGTFSNRELHELAPTSFDVIFRNSVYEGDALTFYRQPAENGLDIRVSCGETTALLVHME
ncbi:MAG: hypothetical protein J6Y62_08595 [Clostridia bacterium]|nr:hypothetical protein [Clostridia bacterium]